MSFRRDKVKALEWQKWLQKNHDELIASDVPPTVLAQESHWLYFLDHGYFAPQGHSGPIIHVDRMSQKSAERLCRFLEQDDYYPSSSALNRLQYLLKRGRHTLK